MSPQVVVIQDVVDLISKFGRLVVVSCGEFQSICSDICSDIYSEL